MSRRFEHHPVTDTCKKIARTSALAGDGEPFKYRTLQVFRGVENHCCQSLNRVTGHFSTSRLPVTVENALLLLLFAQGGGFPLVKARLVEKPSHIRGIKDGQGQMTRIIWTSAGDGDLGRIIANRPPGAVFKS